jgi:uncharacterized protein (TIGR02391 family)
MDDLLPIFERVVRRANKFTGERSEPKGGIHPFDERNIHSGLPPIVRKLFDDGHYSQATFEAYKFLDKEIIRHSKVHKSGFKLMMDAFSKNSPKVKLTPLQSSSENDEQKGFQFLFAGSVLAIRNPRGHENLTDTPDSCLDHLSLSSLLLRRLEKAGYKCRTT